LLENAFKNRRSGYWDTCMLFVTYIYGRTHGSDFIDTFGFNRGQTSKVQMLPVAKNDISGLRVTRIQLTACITTMHIRQYGAAGRIRVCWHQSLLIHGSTTDKKIYGSGMQRGIQIQLWSFSIWRSCSCREVAIWWPATLIL
jgi:hypothetical protein